jgi:hypothetical protein
MNTDAPVLDRWLVCTEDLLTTLRNDLRPIAGSHLLALRLDSGSVTAVPLQGGELGRQVRTLLDAGHPVLRIIFPTIDKAALAELDSTGELTQDEASRLRLHDFGQSPHDVLAALGTPETALQQAWAGGAEVAPRLMPAGPQMTGAALEDLRRAMQQWQQALQDIEELDGLDELAGESTEPDLGNWALPLDLAPELARALPEGIAQSRANPSPEPRPEGPLRMLHWNAALPGIDGFAVQLELQLPRNLVVHAGPITGQITIAERLEPAPGALRLLTTSGNQETVASFDDLRWRPDPADPTRVRAALVSSEADRAAWAAIGDHAAHALRLVRPAGEATSLADVIAAFKALAGEALASGGRRLAGRLGRALGLELKSQPPLRSLGGHSAKGEDTPDLRTWQLPKGLKLTALGTGAGDEVQLLITADATPADMDLLPGMRIQVGQAVLDPLARAGTCTVWQDNGRGQSVTSFVVAPTPELEAAIADPNSMARVVFDD